MINAKVIADSISPAGKRITTMQLVYPRFIHSEFMTHRVFSRNAMSSRAVPVAKMIAQARNNPALPIHWGKNQPGMQASQESGSLVVLRTYEVAGLPPSEVDLYELHDDYLTAQEAWREAADRAAEVAEALAEAGYHKQVVNRLLEPFQWMHTLVTATEWYNFFELRDHPDAQPEFRALARAMRQAMDDSVATPLGLGEWHLPYVSQEEEQELVTAGYNPAHISAARCARVSYLNHDGTAPVVEKDLELFKRLAGGVPFHASPLEHQARPAELSCTASRNFRGWFQFREIYEWAELEVRFPGVNPALAAPYLGSNA